MIDFQWNSTGTVFELNTHHPWSIRIRDSGKEDLISTKEIDK
jgi:hypothetical protein